jgi:chromosome segregation ATPase
MLAGLEETRIRCPNCGRNVPAMKYCIYCGAQLPQRIERPRPTEIPPPVPPLVPPPTPSVQPSSAVPSLTGIEGEVASLMSNISTLYTRKIALFKLFQSGEVSESIFLKLYNEYSGKLSELLNTRVRRLEDLRRRLDEVNRRLNEVALNIEELSVRHKIGEIDLNTFSQKSEKLKIEQRELENIARSIKDNLERLEKILGDKSPSEIKNMEAELQSAYDAIRKMVEEGKISSTILNNVKSDVEETVIFLNSLIRERKERERSLREEIEALQARYKIGEITIEEYEKRKKELQEEINKVWS